ncbi:disease resistance protein RUN1 isoform X2 [Cryptomeria japonica]|uniref:disease resistance protein RUN1 isoform X2 n=1 Tax=Cryptomeria japonica TaxID=3369 RepID=UPI0025AC2070|nr:disease resistance protein RUN1 isoform X2 [Cryptomeria japonica]
MSLSKWSSADSCTNKKYYHDVFLSFRGEDTRGFAVQLHSALVKVGIATFLDSKSLEKGEYISPSLKRGISSSRIGIPIFSKRFADSKWCLKEVGFMEECGKRIIPLFHNVSPSDVRNPDGGIYAKDFEEHESLKTFKPEEITKLKSALQRIGRIPGWSLDQISGEEILIKEVLEKIVNILLSEKGCPDIPTCFGLDWQVKHLLRLLNRADRQKEVVKVGIHGMGGMGKTTLAKVVYNRLLYSRFGLHYFVLRVGERCDEKNGLVKMQTQMLEDISPFRGEIDHVDRGKALLQHFLKGKKILLLLDDIQSSEQLEALGGNFTDLGEGSCLLITTQNQQILKLAKVDETHEVRGLPQEHAMELFKFHALPNPCCLDRELQTLGNTIVSACEGLPLALQLLGKTLAGVADRNVWKGMADKLKCEPNMQKILRASYDTLDSFEKEMFLDTACFLTGTDKEIATIFWAELYRSCHASLRNLLQKSLVNLGPGNELLIHGCLKDLARNLANEMNSQPRKRTRLFDQDAVQDVLHRPLKAKKVCYLGYEPKERKTMEADMFIQLYNLRLLWLSDVVIKGHFPEACYFDELRWLRLTRCSSRRLPPGMNLNKLVILEVICSQITHLCDEKAEEHPNIQHGKLKVLNLSGCVSLEELPATLIYTQLQILDLHNCHSLRSLPITVGTQLRILDLHNCHSLRSLPDTVGSFRSLVSLNMKGSGVSCLPEDFDMLSSLEELDLSWCKNLHNLPANFGNLTRLERLEIHHNPKLRELPDTIGGLKALAYLDAGYCQLCDDGLPDGTFELSSLRVIHLEQNGFCSLPSGLEKLSALWELHLDGCSKLSNLPAVPSSLEMLYARDCARLDNLPCLSGLTSLIRLDVSKSRHLVTLAGLDSLQGLTTLRLMGCQNMSTDTLANCFQGLKSLESVFFGGPGVSRFQLQSFYDSLQYLQAISFQTQCLISSQVIKPTWHHAEANGQKGEKDNCLELCADQNEIKYCAGYIVCCLSLGQVFNQEGTNRLCCGINRKHDLGPRKVIHPDIGYGGEDVLEIRVVRVESNLNFKWLRMGDRLTVNACSDHQQWKACFKFLMYEEADATYPPAEEEWIPTKITFGV